MTDRVTLLFHHSHTPFSNRTEHDVRRLEIHNHQMDYLDIVDALPSGIDMVFVRTDHWKTERSYYQRIEDRVQERNGRFDWHDRHVFFDLDGNQAAVINGVETSLEDKTNHVTIAGLPIDEATYVDLSIEELCDITQDAAWTATAHQKLPGLTIPDETLEALFTAARREDLPIAIGFPSGYRPVYNKLGRGQLPPWRTDVRTFADRYDLPLLPELDAHAALPRKLHGAGVVSNDVMNTLADGDIPVQRILQSDILHYGNAGMPLFAFVKTYAQYVPLYARSIPIAHRQLYERTLPYGEEDFNAVFHHSLPLLSDMTVDDVRTHTRSLQDRETSRQSSRKQTHIAETE